jgi:hypothetical protein
MGAETLEIELLTFLARTLLHLTEAIRRVFYPKNEKDRHDDSFVAAALTRCVSPFPQ